jgi:hypothetical protein
LIIKAEFKTNLAAQLSKQKTIEANLPQFQKPAHQKLARIASMNSQELSQALGSSSSTTSIRKLLGSIDAEEIFKIDEFNDRIASRLSNTSTHNSRKILSKKSITKITTATQKPINLNPEAKLSLSDSNRTPNLPEKIDIVNKWFSSCCEGKSFKLAEVSIDRIAELLVSK